MSAFNATPCIREKTSGGARVRFGAKMTSFPPHELSAGCGFSKQTFAGVGGKREDAPIADTQGNSFFHGAEAIGAWPARRIAVGGRL
jgi:hypothetical protein